jgi:carbon starvation protein
LLWILIGAVVAGAVHDMVLLFASMRHDGLSVVEIAKREIGGFSGLLTSLAVLFILVVSMAAHVVLQVVWRYRLPYWDPVLLLYGTFGAWRAR